MKTLSIIILITSFSLFVNGQTINDFFHPKDINSKVHLKCSDGTITIYEYKIDGSELEIKARSLKKTTEYINIVYKYTITKQKANLTHMNLMTFGKSRNKTDYNPPSTRLVMPLKDKKSEWTFTDEDAKFECTSEFVEIIVNDEKKLVGNIVEAIKVNVNVSTKDKKWKKIKYYVKGIGLYKIEIYEGNKISQSHEMVDIK